MKMTRIKKLTSAMLRFLRRFIFGINDADLAYFWMAACIIRSSSSAVLISSSSPRLFSFATSRRRGPSPSSEPFLSEPMSSLSLSAFRWWSRVAPSVSIRDFRPLVTFLPRDVSSKYLTRPSGRARISPCSSNWESMLEV